MQRLYKFFFLLFLALFVLSTAYGAIISWGLLKIFQLSADSTVTVLDIPFWDYIQLGLYQGLIFSFIELLFVILLLNRSINHHRQYTVRNMLNTVGWFFLVTTVVFIIYAIYYLNSGILTRILLIMEGQFTLAPPLWLPFPIAWITLFIVMAARIKKPV